MSELLAWLVLVLPFAAMFAITGLCCCLGAWWTFWGLFLDGWGEFKIISTILGVISIGGCAAIVGGWVYGLVRLALVTTSLGGFGMLTIAFGLLASVVGSGIMLGLSDKSS